MTARDDYPHLIHVAGASVAARQQARLALDEIDRLRSEVETLAGEKAELWRDVLQLRGEIERYQNPIITANTFDAIVLDAGGGEVRLMVDRNTLEYPYEGCHVRVHTFGGTA